jgi:hypothetical protein
MSIECGKGRKGDVSTNARATNASIVVVPVEPFISPIEAATV